MPFVKNHIIGIILGIVLFELYNRSRGAR